MVPPFGIRKAREHGKGLTVGFTGSRFILVLRFRDGGERTQESMIQIEQLTLLKLPHLDAQHARHEPLRPSSLVF